MKKLTPTAELRAVLEENARERAALPQWMQNAPRLFVPRSIPESPPPRRDESDR